jgi:hypothetical protein
MLLRGHAASVSSIFLRNQEPTIPVLEATLGGFEEADFIRHAPLLSVACGAKRDGVLSFLLRCALPCEKKFLRFSKASISQAIFFAQIEPHQNQKTLWRNSAQ